MKLFQNLCFQKLVALMLALLMLLALPACNNAADEVTTPSDQAPPQDNPPAVEMLPEQELRVLGQNVLASSKLEDIQSRAPTMIEYFLNSNADSIGVQECVTNWTSILDEELADRYARVGVAVDGNDKGWFATYVYYRKDKYKVIETDTFWLSTTPEVPSQYGPTVDMNRTCTWVVLENIETGFRYVHMNCHLDWMDTSVNLLQIQMIRNVMDRFAKMGYPVFATGDFNTGENSSSYRRMVASNWVDDSKVVAEKSDKTVSHFGNNKTIDYCFVTGSYMTVKEYDVIENVHNDVEISDHNGIFVHAIVKSLPKQKNPVPQLASDAEITVTMRGGHMIRNVEVTIPQAKDELGTEANTYELVLKDQEGTEVSKTYAHSGAYRSIVPKAATALVAGGESGNTYRLEITPISMLGARGETVEITFLWSDTDKEEVKAPSAPDILDVSVKDGVVADASPNRYELTMVKTVTVTDDAMVFNRNSAFRTPNMESQYSKLADGFTMEAVLTTGSNITASQNYVSNHQGGGYAFKCKDGVFSLAVHNGSKYVSASANVDPNTTYHVIGVYDGMDLYLYLNGELMDVVEFGSTLKFPTNDGAKYLCIGADTNTAGTAEYYADATIYKVAIYSEILTVGEVAYLSQNQ